MRGFRRCSAAHGVRLDDGDMVMELFSLVLIIGALAVVLPMALRIFRDRDDH